jgi:hypothetical protein
MAKIIVKRVSVFFMAIRYAGLNFSKSNQKWNCDLKRGLYGCPVSAHQKTYSPKKHLGLYAVPPLF